MSEEKKVEQAAQAEGSKTLVSFIVGLLIGGMLVWAFSGGEGKRYDDDNNDGDDHATEEQAEESSEENSETGDSAAGAEVTATPVLLVGDGAIAVNDQPAGLSVVLDSATYPIEEGWIGVRDYNDGQLSFIKGVVRFSAAAGLVPETIALQVPTIAGQEYAVVVFSDNGDNAFNTAGDVQIDQIFATFIAQ